MKKKRKLRKLPIIILVILIGVLVYLFILPDNTSKKLYSKEAINILKENKKTEIYKKDYSKTLDYMLKEGKHNIEYLEEYLNINYIEKDDFLDKINNYLQIGYKSNEINNIFKLSNLNQDKLLNKEKLNFEKYINIKNFDVNNIERYEEYEKNNNYELKDVVTYVNINLDKKYYSETKEAVDPNNLLVLVNKYNYLPNNYKPSDLTYLPGAYGNNVPLREVLKNDFVLLQKAAKDEINIKLMPTTAFRDQGFQTTLYNNYVNKDGKEEADTYSARPGYSEHQTGLAIDLKNTALSDIRLTDENYEWLENNAYKYGFIIRFPKGKEFITGYQFENWHIRYVGKEAAKVIYDNKLTLEEYIDLYITKY